MQGCKLSVITVCYNAEKTIENTILSILNQTYHNYEYIVVDGKSTDGTNQIIKRYLSAFHKRKINVKYISESDNGIYDAMNKGIEMAEGEWIAFMNADDSYYDKEVLSKVFEEPYDGYDVLYGSTNYITEEEEKIDSPLPLDVLSGQMAFAHQSAFVRTSIMKSKKFDLSYELASDYQLFLELWLEHKRFYCIENVVISNFSYMGKSRTKGYQSVKELLKIRCLHDIPGNSKAKLWFDYIWWIGVHLGGLRDIKINRRSKKYFPVCLKNLKMIGPDNYIS